MWYIHGAEFKLDVGLYQLDQQVACQRYRQTILDANSKIRSAVAYLSDKVNTIAAGLATPVTVAV